MNTAETPLIEGRELHAYYGVSHILHGVSLSVVRGEAIGLMGRNGMGKSTLIRTLMGLVRPRSGAVLVHGRDVTRTPTHRIAREGIAYVPEGRAIFPNLSVRENLVMAARPGRRREWTYERVLDAFPRLAERRHHLGSQLSGGEQQMLAISRALMTNPELLILDEATEGLALLVARQIWAIIRSIRESGVATVIVDKNHAAVTSVTSRNLILVKGRAVFEGTSDELRARPDILQKHLGV